VNNTNEKKNEKKIMESREDERKRQFPKPKN